MTDGFEAFKRTLLAAFPPRPFHGLVSTHDECEEGIDLRAELPGKRWDEIPNAFIDFYSASPCLREPEALVSFLPAWLLRAAERLDEHSVLSELTLYFLSPGNEEEGWDEAGITELAGLFNAEQRKVLGAYLESILRNDQLGSWHSHAEHGLRWWHG